MRKADFRYQLCFQPVVGVFLILIGALTATTYAVGDTSDSRELLWIEKGKTAVTANLKDPDSAKFRYVYFHIGRDNIPVACGEVNSKNSFGGYSGFQKFISAGSTDRTYLEEEVSDFPILWSSLCTDGETGLRSRVAKNPTQSSTGQSTSTTGMWAVQLGSFSNKDNAEKLAADLRKQGYAAFLSQLTTDSGQLHRVRIGPQKDRESAEAMAARLLRVGRKGQVVPHP